MHQPSLVDGDEGVGLAEIGGRFRREGMIEQGVETVAVQCRGKIALRPIGGGPGCARGLLRERGREFMQIRRLGACKSGAAM